MEEKYALLIDAENVSPKYIRPILQELSKYGRVTYKRIYGDWTNVQRAGWKESLLAHSITPIQQFRYVEGKNASDTALIIDAMDMLHGGQLDGFCIVSSDSDFTRLIERLREGGKEVIVMGEEKTPKALRNASDVFTVLEDILDDSDDIVDENEKEQGTSDSVSKNQIENIIIQFVSENQNKNRETGLAEVGSRLTSIYPDFDVRRYGYSLLSKFLKTLPRLEVYQTGSHQAYVRIKDNEEKRNSIYDYIQSEVTGSGKRGIPLGTLGRNIHEQFEDFQSSDFGYSRFYKFIESIDGVKIVKKRDEMFAVSDK